VPHLWPLERRNLSLCGHQRLLSIRICCKTIHYGLTSRMKANLDGKFEFGATEKGRTLICP
jgi:hypothetical protein